MASAGDKRSAQQILKAESGEIRSMRPHEYFIVSALAISWALFQLALAGFFVLDSTKTRAIHLAFAMGLLYLLFPCIRRPTKYFRFLGADDRIPVIDYLLAALSVAASLYLALDYNGIAMRSGGADCQRSDCRFGPGGLAAGSFPAGDRPGPGSDCHRLYRVCFFGSPYARFFGI